MRIKRVDNILNEMAFERSDGVKLCIDLGYEFVSHFKKTFDNGASALDFKHHCAEMQAWWNKIREIKWKFNKKQISKIDLIDLFFTCGSDVETILGDEYEEVYEKFILILLQDYNTSIEEAFMQIF